MSIQQDKQAYYQTEFRLDQMDKIEDVLGINDSNEMDSRMFMNVLSITKILKVYNKKLSDNFTLNKEEIEILLYSLKFIDTLNLFINNQALQGILKSIDDIHELVNMINNLPQQEDVLKQIKYTQKSIIYFKKKNFRNLFFGDGVILGEELEKCLSQVSQSGIFDYRTFKQLQNIFYVVQSKVEENYRDELQIEFNEMKEKSIKLKNKKFGKTDNNQFDFDEYTDYIEYKNLDQPEQYENNYEKNYEKSYDNYPNNYSYNSGRYNSNYNKQQGQNTTYKTNNYYNTNTNTNNSNMNYRQNNSTNQYSSHRGHSFSYHDKSYNYFEKKDQTVVQDQYNKNYQQLNSSNKNDKPNVQNYYNENFYKNYLYYYDDKNEKKQNYKQDYTNKNNENVNVQNNDNLTTVENNLTPVKTTVNYNNKKYGNPQYKYNNYNNNNIKKSNSDLMNVDITKTQDIPETYINQQNNNSNKIEESTNREKEREINKVNTNTDTTVVDSNNQPKNIQEENTEIISSIITKQKPYNPNNTNYYNNNPNYKQNNYTTTNKNYNPTTYNYNTNINPTTSTNNYYQYNNRTNNYNAQNTNYYNNNYYSYSANPKQYKNEETNNYYLNKKTNTYGYNTTNNNYKNRTNSYSSNRYNNNNQLRYEFVDLEDIDINKTKTQQENNNNEQYVSNFEEYNQDKKNINIDNIGNIENIENIQNIQNIQNIKNNNQQDSNHKEMMTSDNDNKKMDFGSDDHEGMENEIFEEIENEDYLDEEDEVSSENEESEGEANEEEMQAEFEKFINTAKYEKMAPNRYNNEYSEFEEETKNNKIIFDDDDTKTTTNTNTNAKQDTVEPVKEEPQNEEEENIENKENLNNQEEENLNVKETTKGFLDSIKNIDPSVLEKIKAKLSGTNPEQTELKKDENLQYNEILGDTNLTKNFAEFYKNNFIQFHKNFNKKLSLQNYMYTNYAHFFFRGRDANIHREYYALKCLETENPSFINNNYDAFENKILIPLYQKINYNVNKKKGIYHYTYNKYQKLIYKILNKDKVLKQVKPYGSFMNNFLIDSGDIDICIVSKIGILDFSNYLEKIKEEIAKLVI
jgi:hypothetical protein